MRISQKGIDLIKYFTECNLSSYYNTANVLAIGYGHTGKDVKRNMKITQEQAEALLQNDLAHVEYMLNVRFVGDLKLKQNQYDAVCSFVYSVGVHAFLKSTMFALLMKKDYENASNQLVWQLEYEIVDGGIKVKAAESLPASKYAFLRLSMKSISFCSCANTTPCPICCSCF